MIRHRNDLETVRRIARERFGYAQMRPGQEEVLQHVLAGHDILCVMPTGAGKSAIYQLAALLIDGPTVIVSPLIALQKDQREAIEEMGLADVAVVNSTVRVSDRREAFEKLEDEELEFLFLAPEQFGNEATLKQVLDNRPSLFVVDEAHCVSEWGHDFRPDYAQLGPVIEALDHPVVLALTATASPLVRQNIIDRLGMRDPRVVVMGFDRPNIWLGVEKCADEAVKLRVLTARVKDWPRPMIIYVATHRHAEEIAAILREDGHRAAFYHGGMNKTQRHETQDQFMTGELDIVIATNAFGMGVDKADVRTVIHYDVPESLDAYYQEVGRAGRDGEEAHALLLYRPEDLGIRRAMAARGKLSEEDVAEVAEVVLSRRSLVEPKEIAELTELGVNKVKKALSRLEEVGAVKLLPGGAAERVERRVSVEEAAEDAAAEQDRFVQYRKGRVEMIRDFAETTDCRRRYLLNYFGERMDEPCGNCDNCESGLSERTQKEQAEEKLPFALKSRVMHKKLGEGTVMRYEGNKVIVLFPEAGYKELVTRYVIEKKLLKQIE